MTHRMALNDAFLLLTLLCVTTAATATIRRAGSDRPHKMTQSH